MIVSIKIKNFKILKEINIESLKEINLFTGENSDGKSSILEALAIFIEGIDNNELVRDGDISTHRIYPWQRRRFENLINKEAEENFYIELESKGGASYIAKFNYNNQLLFIEPRLLYNRQDVTPQISGTRYSVMDKNIIDKITDSCAKEEFIKFKEILLNSVFIPNWLPDIPDYKAINSSEGKLIEYIAEMSIPGNYLLKSIDDELKEMVNTSSSGSTHMTKNPSLWAGWVKGNELESRIIYSVDKQGVDSGAIYINLAHEGFGIRKIIEIMLNVIRISNDNREGIVLIEEPENGLSFNNIIRLGKIIEKFSTERKIQFLITTHNPCLIKGINNLGILSVYTIQKGKSCLLSERIIKEIRDGCESFYKVLKIA